MKYKFQVHALLDGHRLCFNILNALYIYDLCRHYSFHFIYTIFVFVLEERFNQQIIFNLLQTTLHDAVKQVYSTGRIDVKGNSNATFRRHFQRRIDNRISSIKK